MKNPLILLVLLLPLATEAQTTPKPTVPSTEPTAPSQILAPPPIKMGLWKTTATSAIGGIEIPPEVAARMKAAGRSFGQTTATTLSCITPEKWKQMFNRSQHDQRCQLTNQQQTASGMSADISCTSARGTDSSGHMSITFDSDTKMHGTIHMTVTTQSRPQPMNLDTTLQGTYQGADCQGISPDSPKIVQ